ncbi:MAG: hypothetical protein H6715_00065 [Myxococcales bacterium]|nr:hypothetical protein [Myxococcales bacterium]MCB9707359.1 hypothetical protein [Myxococcales bacterium]
MKITEELLNRYHDGELSPAESQHVREAVDKDPELQKQLATLRRLSTFLHTHAVQNPELAAISLVYENVRHEIAARDSWRDRFQHAFQPKKEFWLGWALPVGGTVLLAAVVLFVWMPSARQDNLSAERMSHPSKHAASQGIEELEGSSEFVEMDLGENSGTVIDIEPEAGEHVAILWVEEPE